VFGAFFKLAHNGRRYDLFACPTPGGLAWFLPIAAPLEISYVDYPVIAPLRQSCWVLLNSLFIHRVIGTIKNHDKQMKYTVLLAVVFIFYLDILNTIENQ
jgi:hypothetical protein